MHNILLTIQIIISMALIILVLIQDRGEGIGESLGGTQSEGYAKTKRGMDKTLHTTTIILVIAFATTSILLLTL